jgi:hypothetical protein
VILGTKPHHGPLTVSVVPNLTTAGPLVIPSYTQGAAVSSGYLWISRGEFAWGFLEKLDLAPGRAAGSRSTTGGLWGVSEVGACHVRLRHPFFRVIFRFDLDRITPAARYR